MPINWKRIALLIGLLLVVAAVGFFFYFVFLRPALVPSTDTTPQPTGGTGQQPGEGLPRAGTNVNIPVIPGIGEPEPLGQEPSVTGTPVIAPTDIAQGGATKAPSLIDHRVLNPALSTNGSQLRYYNQDDGYFYEIGTDGTAKKLSDKKFFDVSAIIWSQDRSQAVLEYPDGANILYNFNTQQQITYPKHWTEFSFSPNGKQLAFKSLGTSPEDRWLAVTNADSTQARLILPLGDKPAAAAVEWSPNNQVIASYTVGLDFNRQTMRFVGPNNESYPTTVIEGRDYRGVWSPQGDRLLYSVYSANSDYLPSLWIVNGQGELMGRNHRDLGLNTWADKCTFGGNEVLYCAVPQQLPESAGLAQKEFTDVPSDIFRIDLRSGFRTLIATPDTTQPIGRLIVSQDNRFLYFVGGQDNELHQLRLR